jgi:uncharacterized protein
MKTSATSWRIILLLGGLAAGGRSNAIPPPPEQLLADCSIQTYASDILVCATPELRALDTRLRMAMIGIDLEGLTAPGAIVETQKAWFMRRSHCAFSARHAACLYAAYAERIGIYDALQIHVRTAAYGLGNDATCDEAPWASGPVHVVIPGRSTAVIWDQTRRALAVPAESWTSDWAPFMRLEIEGSSLKLISVEGTSIRCRLTAQPNTPLEERLAR